MRQPPTLILLFALMAFALPSMAQWENELPEQRRASNLHAAHALFNLRTANDIESLKSLAQMRNDNRAQGLAAALHYAAIGLPEKAERLAAPATHERLAPKALLAIAQTYYEQHDFAAAERVLVSMGPQVNTPEMGAKASLLARALLQQSRYNEATISLAANRQFGEISQLDRYNLAIAWLGAGQPARGAGMLDALGRYDGADKARRALADQANLMLGYWLLRNQRARQARVILWRIPLSSPAARKGMLGLGWSEIMDTAQAQATVTSSRKECVPASADLWAAADPLHKAARTDCRVPKIENKKGTLAAAPGYSDAQNRFSRAAAAWQAAADQGDPLNPVVAEALTALPYAIKRAGDLASAQSAYENAIKALRGAQARLEQQDIDMAARQVSTQHLFIRQGQSATSLDALHAYVQNMAVPDISNTHENAGRDVGQILRDLKASAPIGRRLARPSAVQRGRLITALSLAQKPNAQLQTSAQALQTRLVGLKTRLARAQQSTHVVRSRREQEYKKELGETLRVYLRQASLGLANISSTAAN